MYEVACTRKEASCIIGHLVDGLALPCEYCRARPDDRLVIETGAEVYILGDAKAGTAIRGRDPVTQQPITVIFTDYGLKLDGVDAEAVERIRRTRCIYGLVNAPEKG